MQALRRQGRSGGFSFIELLASAAIIGLLASIAVPVVQTSIKRQKERDLRIALRDIRQGIDAYKQAAVAGRIAVLQDQSGYPPSLAALAAGVDDASKPEHPKLYFLRRIPRDPFFPAQDVKAADTWGKRSFASPADKPEEGDDVFDVYSLSPQTGLNSVPYREW